MLQARSGQRYENRPCHNTYTLTLMMPSGSVYSQVSPLLHTLGKSLLFLHTMSLFISKHFILSQYVLSTLLSILILQTHPDFFLSMRRKQVSRLYVQIITNQCYCTTEDMMTHIFHRQTDRQNVSQVECVG